MRILIIIALIVGIWGCSKSGFSIKECTYDVAWMIQDEISYVKCIGSNIVTFHTMQDTLVVSVYDTKGSVIKTFKILQGKGPGEIKTLDNMVIGSGDDSMVVLYDGIVRKYVFYDLKGAFIDEYLVQDVQEDMVRNVISFNDTMVTTSQVRYKISIIDKNGRSIRNVEFDTPRGIFLQEQVGKPINACELTADTDGNLYIGYWSYPFRIEKYDKDLNVIYKKTHDFGAFDPVTVSEMGMPSGQTMIESMVTDGKYIYTMWGSGLIVGNDFSIAPAPIKENAIHIFDAATGDYNRSVWNKKLPLDTTYKIIGTIDGKLYLTVDRGVLDSSAATPVIVVSL